MAPLAPTPAPTLYQWVKRNDVAASAASTITAQQQQAEATTSATSSAPSSTSSGYTNNGGYFGNVWGGNFSTNWVTWVSIVVLVGLLLGIMTARFFYIRRYYPPTLRSYFVPTKGIHVNRLGIHIRGPPPRIPHENPPPYVYVTEIYGRRRRRRGRQTVGDTVGEGGARIGERDEDDMFDGDLAERASVSGGTAPVARELLPRYYVDAGLPMYEVGDGTAAEEAERIRAEAAVAGAESDEVDALPTAAEYEAASRAARNNAASGGANGGENAEAGTSEVEEQRDHGDERVEGATLYPPRPPPVARSTTGRSSLLAAFSRNRAPSPERSHPHGQRPPLTSRTTTNGIDDDDFGSSSASTSTVSTTIDALPTMRRTMSLESGATGSTTDADPLGSKSRVKKIQPGRPGLAEASSSSVKIDPELQHKEEATTEAPSSMKEEDPADADRPSSDRARDPDARRDDDTPP